MHLYAVSSFVCFLTKCCRLYFFIFVTEIDKLDILFFISVFFIRGEKRHRGFKKLGQEVGIYGQTAAEFRTEEVMGAHYFNFAPQILAKMVVFEPKVLYFGHFFDRLKFRVGQLPPLQCHDSSDAVRFGIVCLCIQIITGIGCCSWRTQSLMTNRCHRMQSLIQLMVAVHRPAQPVLVSPKTPAGLPSLRLSPRVQQVADCLPETQCHRLRGHVLLVIHCLAWGGSGGYYPLPKNPQLTDHKKTESNQICRSLTQMLFNRIAHL